jgi:hypothetical protein
VWFTLLWREASKPSLLFLSARAVMELCSSLYLDFASKKKENTGDAYREGCPSSLDRFAEKKPKSVRAVLTCVLCVCGRSADVDDALHFMRSV